MTLFASGDSQCPTTDWTNVREARGSRIAMAALLYRYESMLHRFLRVQMCVPREQADEVLQDFIFEKIIAGNLLKHANKDRGRFRSLLRTAMRHHCINFMTRKTGAPPAASHRAPYDESANRGVSASVDDPSHAFDIAWARQTIQLVLERMRGECLADDREHLWYVFESRLVNPMFHNTTPGSYNDLVRQCGFASPDKACNALTTAKRMFERMLREHVSRYAGEAQVDDEINDLKRILARQNVSGTWSPRDSMDKDND